MEIRRNHKWTKKEFAEIAKKYSRPSDWQKNDARTYSVARRKPYYAEIAAHMEIRRNHKWTKKELAEIAKKYTSPSDWRKNDVRTYDTARKKPYYAEITAHMTRKTTKELKTKVKTNNH